VYEYIESRRLPFVDDTKGCSHRCGHNPGSRTAALSCLHAKDHATGLPVQVQVENSVDLVREVKKITEAYAHPPAYSHSPFDLHYPPSPRPIRNQQYDSRNARALLQEAVQPHWQSAAIFEPRFTSRIARKYAMYEPRHSSPNLATVASTRVNQ
jgi:hypothetical protein